MNSSFVPSNSQELEFLLKLAQAEILSTYGDAVNIKPKTLLKFGASTNIDQNVKSTIMTLPGATQRHETYVYTNAIDSISSGAIADTGNEIYIEGHTIDGDGNLTFVTQTVNLDGTSGRTRVALSTPLCRATRAENRSAEGNELTGPVYIYENSAITNGKPDDDTKTHLMIASGQNKSEKAATAISSQDYFIVTQVYASVLKGGASGVGVDFELQSRRIENSAGKIFTQKFEFTVTRDGQVPPINLNPYVIIPKNSDVRLVGDSSANDTSVRAWFNGYFGLVQS